MGPQCPQCGRDFVRRSHREGTLEHLLSVVFVYPFRCQLCAHRFLALQWGAHYKKEFVDQREYERLPVRRPAAFSGDQMHGEGTVTELSIRGCTLETGTRLVEGALLRMSFHPTGQDPSVEVEAAVVRSVRGSGAGLEFLRIQPQEKESLRRVLMRLHAERRE